jgi:hypothetical protein
VAESHSFGGEDHSFEGFRALVRPLTTATPPLRLNFTRRRLIVNWMGKGDDAEFSYSCTVRVASVEAGELA